MTLFVHLGMLESLVHVSHVLLHVLLVQVHKLLVSLVLQDIISMDLLVAHLAHQALFLFQQPV